jgi:hypothetical protein
MTSFRGDASLAKMMSPEGELTGPACHPTKNVNKAEELTYLSTNIAQLTCLVGLPAQPGLLLLALLLKEISPN